jgi:hypothetical protein
VKRALIGNGVERVAEAAPLVLLSDKAPKAHEDDPTLIPEGFFCSVPAVGVRWLRADGELEYVRCGASNRCDYCGMLAACENAVVMRLDAFDGGFPRVGMTTTTHTPDVGLDGLYEAERYLWRWLRHEKSGPRYGSALQYAGFLEWTTGESRRSRGWRLPHIHHLVKGIPADEAAGLRGEISKRWKEWTGGAWVVESRELTTPIGAIAYLVLHHHKREQGPPSGTRRVRRLRCSRAYMNRPIVEYRKQARGLLKDERLYARLVGALNVPDGVPDFLIEELIAEHVDEARERAQFDAPELVHVRERRIVDRVSGEVTLRFEGVLRRLRSSCKA